RLRGSESRPPATTGHHPERPRASAYIRLLAPFRQARIEPIEDVIGRRLALRDLVGADTKTRRIRRYLSQAGVVSSFREGAPLARQVLVPELGVALRDEVLGRVLSNPLDVVILRCEAAFRGPPEKEAHVPASSLPRARVGVVQITPIDRHATRVSHPKTAGYAQPVLRHGPRPLTGETRHLAASNVSGRPSVPRQQGHAGRGC